jgi:general secretion pathway protein N
MRIRLPLGRSLFFLCAFLFAIVALLPLRLALGWLGMDKRGLAAREVKGSIWLGGLSEVQAGGVSLGDLSARLATLPLFIGRARMEVRRDDAPQPFRGAVTVSRHRFGVDDLSGRVDAASLFAGLPLAGLDLTDISVQFADGLCASADGMVKAELGASIAGVSLPGGLSGTARCEDGALLLPLRGQSGAEALAIRVHGDGRYRAEVTLPAGDAAMQAQAAAAGLAAGPSGGYVFAVDGRF